MMKPFIDSSPSDPDGAALAARMRRDGYLFLPGLLPRDDVAAVQRQVGDDRARRRLAAATTARWRTRSPSCPASASIPIPPI